MALGISKELHRALVRGCRSTVDLQIDYAMLFLTDWFLYIYMPSNDRCRNGGRVVRCFLRIIYFSDGIGDHMCQRALNVLLSIWLQACLRNFPSPRFWWYVFFFCQLLCCVEIDTRVWKSMQYPTWDGEQLASSWRGYCWMGETRSSVVSST